MKDKMKAARSYLAVKRPYLGSALFSMQMAEAPDELWLPNAPTMCVDSKWRLLYSKTFVEKHNESELVGVLLHEVYHLIRMHHSRLDRCDKRKSNIAFDLEINDDIRDEGFQLPEGVIYPDMKPFNFDLHLTGEEYYSLLGKNKDWEKNFPAPEDRTIGGGGGDLDQELNDKIKEHMEKVLGRGITEAEAKVIQRKVAQEIQNHKGVGDIPGHLKRWAGEIVDDPKVPWQKELSTYVRNAVEVVRGRMDYSYGTPGRRRIPRVVTPSMIRPKPKVTCVLDTSGSMSEDELKTSLIEIRGILKTVGLSIRVITCDSEISRDLSVTDISKISLQGGGGTDMRVPLNKLDKEKTTDICVVLTDGGTPWPDTPTRYTTIVCCTTEEKCPEWTKTLRI